MNPPRRPMAEHRSASHGTYPVNQDDPNHVRAGDPAAVQRALTAVARHLGPGGSSVNDLERLTGGASQETWAFTVGEAEIEYAARVAETAWCLECQGGCCNS